MSYFRTNDRYLIPDPVEPPVEPPWGVEVGEEGAGGRVTLRWRRPYTPVDSYGVVGQQASGPITPAGGRELLRVAAPATEARLALGPGTWHLAVIARRGATDSAPAAVVWEVAGLVMPSVLPAMPPPPEPPPVQAILPITTPSAALPPAPALPSAPVCPSCGGRVVVAADGAAACAYCGCAVAITLDGRALVVDGLLYGTCTCCVPRRPLIRHGAGLVCPAHPEQPYSPPHAETTQPPTPNPQPPTPEWDWNTIDRALRDNSAQLGQHGLFVRG